MTQTNMTRRAVLAAGGATALVAAGRGSFAQTEKPVTDLKPGEWSWYPERALDGPVAVLVSLSDQLAFVYRNGIRIGVSTVSTGRKGYETPTGVFTVLIKEKMHHSRAYNNAAMPDSQFFFGGCALHAGGLPGYPSSHGCVHLPRAFADLVFGVTHNGTPVIVTNDRSGIGSLSHSGLVLSNADLKTVEAMTTHVAGKKLPRDKEGERDDAIAIIVSGADRRLIALRNGSEFINAGIGIEHPRLPLGTHVYLLKGVNPATHVYDWMAIGLGTGDEAAVDVQREIAVTARLVIPPDVYAQIARNLHPGATMMLTDLPAHPETRSATDFVIMRDRTSV
ncbi:L,D-transpeptidase [Hoeflea alexandrii]|uniref:L,D-transpeptidase family protein n=1 Tax=Hoeflea alexandrii TaxID=288436 RepID=A0ABT1CWD5_9HYPH|nr:L,D-transpeptidase [Hoeflea alexandrii]MBV6648668.1 L,D-transpeptidase [Hoeflea sp.]MCO6409850.1 L,D-transpeptidase family protein [Hoeflea alexandrii]MCY0152852.1 L,D-transpeptidase [Hoeflea alexandrii]